MRGKGHSLFHSPEVEQDHPRLCGEKTDLIILTLNKLGSPPPMRGKASKRIDGAVTLRITPAYAGKSAHFSGNRADREDHPRLCGEKPAVRSFPDFP